MFLRRSVAVLMTLVFAAGAVFAQPQRPPRKKKKNEDKEPITQTLPLLPDPPGAVAAETARLVFHVSPLSSKGLMSQQTRDALTALLKANGGATIVKIMAYVAGTGDMRRVQTIVSELFTEKKKPLPALTTVQVGALPLEGAQVVLESISEDKKTVNPNGLAFIAGQKGSDIAAAISKLQAITRTPGITMVQLTCFTGSLNDTASARAAVAAAFPAASANFVQPQRFSSGSLVECAGAGRLDAPLASGVKPQIAVATSPKLVFSGLQMAFGNGDADIRLALDRLRKILDPLGVGYPNVISGNLYALGAGSAEKTRELRASYIGRDTPLAGMDLVIEGLPSLDGTVGLDVIAESR